MAPRSGGETDKFGNRYEGTWTVRQMLEVLHGRAVSITVERTGEAGEGVEFTLERKGGREEAHQVKRQSGSAVSWTVRMLRDEGVLAAAEKQVEAGREFHFASLIPSPTLRELADRARRSSGLDHFVKGQLTASKLRRDFDLLGSEIWGTPEHAWAVLRGLYVRWPDEEELRDTNAALAGVLLDRAPAPTAALALGDLIANNLALPLNLETIKNKLGDYELSFSPLAGRAGIRDRLTSLTNAWREGTAAEMLDPPIPRAEAAELMALFEGDERLILASGNAGDGKTSVLNQTVAKAGDSAWPILALRLDRREAFESAQELGDQLELPASPAAALAGIAGGGPALLLIDQLDAVSLASGRMPGSFGAVAEILGEAAAFPEMRVLMAARQFDIENDDRLRGLVDDSGPARDFRIGPLSTEQVGDALFALGVDRSALDDNQVEILRSPLHLVLFGVAASEGDAPGFSNSKDLFDLFWERKMRSSRLHPSRPRFTEVIDALLEAMSRAQRLAAPASALDDGDLLADAEVLASEHVLVKDGGQLAFFHEAFFDYAFARRWTGRDEGVVAFLLAGGQELFRRAQVRQILTHLREEDPRRFRREVTELLSNEKVRFHIKDVVLRLLQSLPCPDTEEWRMFEALLASGGVLEDRLRDSLRSVDWFDRLFAEGVLESWLSSGEEPLRARAVDILASAVKVRTEEVARLLAPLREEIDFPKILLWIARFAPIEQSRPLFDLLHSTISDGRIDGRDDDLWIDVHGLAEMQPGWAAELLHAFLVERPGTPEVGADGKIADLEIEDSGLLELVTGAAAGAPERFLELLLPYLLEVMAATDDSDEAPIRDRHFSRRYWRADIHRLEDALLQGTRRALTTLASQDPQAIVSAMNLLVSDQHDASQWLLYECLRAAAPAHADRAARILLEGSHRFESGFIASPHWTTRQLLEAIGNEIDTDLFSQLEAELLTLEPEYEKGSEHRGYSSFTLLSALPETRLSAQAMKRLGELQRKFEQDEPHEPMGIVVGTVHSPIGQEAAEHMSDDQWMAAISKYASGERWDRIGLVGDAPQLAQVLESETRSDPSRFVSLAMRFTADTHPAYTNAVLSTIGENKVTTDPMSVFALLRHVDAIGNADNDSYLGEALSQHLDAEIPDDIIEMLLRRALESANPEEERWLEDGDPWSQGMNSVRGRAAERLADLLRHDANGKRSAIVAPKLDALAEDRIIAVRSSVARLIAASLRHERAVALGAFAKLVNGDDRLLATRPVEQLVVDIGKANPEIVNPLIGRMLDSSFETVRKVGGRLAAFAGLELESTELLSRAVSSPDAAIREGAATVCAGLLPWTSDSESAATALVGFFADQDDSVREAAGMVAAELRGRDLSPHLDVLRSLISSPSFPAALPQLLITLEDAIGAPVELGLECAERFLSIHEEEVGDIRTSAAADSRHVAELLLRTYTQSSIDSVRNRVLDAIDRLLLARAFGIDELVKQAER